MWEAGVGRRAARSPASGRAGGWLRYWQEHYAGHAEDRARVLGLDGRATVPYGSFAEMLLTEETTPLEPPGRAAKYYARDVGPVLAVTVKGGSGREELTSSSSASGARPRLIRAPPGGG